MSAVVLTIQDKTAAGKVTGEINVSFKTSNVTLKDIIEARVISEVENYNKKLSEFFNGLVQPTHAERTLNGYRMKERKKVDPEKQVYIALDAFQRNAYFVLIDNMQVDSLAQELAITKNTHVSFVKLTPLVGG